MKDIKAKIEAQIVKQKGPLKDRCWIWQGTRISNRYPGIKLGSQLLSVRRLVYLEYGNQPLLGKKSVRSLCNDPLCVNPKHLVRSNSDAGGNSGKERSKRGANYPWDAWFALPSFTLVRGTNFNCTVSSMSMMIRQRAYSLGRIVRLKIDGDRITATLGD